jgi:hypothetical protein
MGREASFMASRDSGASVGLAYKVIVDQSAYTGETITVRGLFGPEVKVPIAVVHIKSPKFHLDDYLALRVDVVSTKLPFDVDLLIGNDLSYDSCNLFDVIRVEGCFQPVERAAEAQPAVDGKAKSVLVLWIAIPQTGRMSDFCSDDAFDVYLLIGNDLSYDSCNLFDVIRVEGCFQPVERAAEAQPAVDGIVCNSNVIVSSHATDGTRDSSSAIETVADHAC